MKECVVVGAGSAGLTLAYYLCKAGQSVTVLECENEVGGLARSFTYGDSWHFDIGPHRFYTADPLVLNFLRDVQEKDFLNIPRFSSVFFMGHYHQWPLRLKTVAKLPPLVALRAGIDLLFRGQATKPDDVSFQNYTLQRYGKTLYETFFKDYTEKFVGIPAAKTHLDWAKVGVERATIDNKVDTASLGKIFKLMLLPKPTELNFLYPNKGGIQSFWDRCAQCIIDMGGRIVTGVKPLRLETNGGKVTKVITEKGEFTCDHLAWSAPLNALNDLLGISRADLSYRSHVIFNTMLSAPPLINFQWCYYGAREFTLSRISNPAAFSPTTVPAGKGGLCLEVACQEGDDVWNDPESLRTRLVDDLLKVKIISSEEQIEDMRWERVPNAYPIYHLRYKKELDRNDAALSSWSNVRLLGRTGKFWYNNMDHSIENACQHALSLLRECRESSPALQEVIEQLTHPPAAPGSMTSA